MRHFLQAVLLFLLVGCSNTTVTRVRESNQALYPDGRVHVGWSDDRIPFNLMIHADVALPPVGASIPARKAFRDISILNCRSDDTEYPRGGKDAWLREMRGSLHLISEDQIVIDAYFLDGAGKRQPYPFSGEHHIDSDA
ncbi:hypothetical protein [Luteolibacter marinus]|uniref:hypothetical protein n=1 Tax=Luteolibacter marinus TaxID=2776705 RepID=UPI0018681619|nr:hypothetical protein [Luteolibacter marinus]